MYWFQARANQPEQQAEYCDYQDGNYEPAAVFALEQAPDNINVAVFSALEQDKIVAPGVGDAKSLVRLGTGFEIQAVKVGDGMV